MGALHYNRAHEREADIEGLHMLQAAHLDPAAMVAIYSSMQQSEQNHQAPPEFLSTHPDMNERLATLVALAGPTPPDPQPLLPGEDWADIRSLCRLRDPGRSVPVSHDLP